MIKKILGFAVVFAILPTAVLAQWAPLEKGLAYRSSNFSSSSDDQQIHLLRIDPSRFRVDVLLGKDFGTPILTAQRYREKSGAIAAINGGFFDEFHHSMGLLHRNGKTLNPLRNNSWGVFVIEGKHPKIIARKDWNPAGVLTALQVGPRLVVDGKVLGFKETLPARRSAVGITQDGQVVIAVSEKPIYLKEWAEFLKQDCVQALNLDGGGSTQLSVATPKIKITIEGETAVPNVVAVFRK